MHPDDLLRFGVDSSRPIELVTVVLKAVALAVMKRCGIAWAGMAKGGIHDVGGLAWDLLEQILMPCDPLQQEDWHSEKADISLHEGTPIGRVFGELDQAISWLSCTTQGKVIHP